MVWLSEKWAEVDKLNDTITQYAREYLTMNEKEARKLQVIRGRENWYETVDNEGVKILMNLDDATCDCGMWQMNGLPCTHAIAVFIMYNKEFPHNHVHWFYSKQAWQLTYEGVINPILDESRWEKVKVPHQQRKRLIKCPMHQLVQPKGLNLMNAVQAILQQHIWAMFAPK
ncbi:hypothetical protein LWI28_008104 [Acer negundo]|uniref:SWIM-type domain-containing protein n=1 Tax=Acer negundo TaxID=4023 RepID=A0AAD5P417_ACENE|nr:hypothetical protein LWI28_008104 [Acer negundo]